MTTPNSNTNLMPTEPDLSGIKTHAELTMFILQEDARLEQEFMQKRLAMRQSAFRRLREIDAELSHE